MILIVGRLCICIGALELGVRVNFWGEGEGDLGLRLMRLLRGGEGLGFVGQEICRRLGGWVAFFLAVGISSLCPLGWGLGVLGWFNCELGGG